MTALARAAILFSTLLASGVCHAESYPARTVKVIVPFAPGGVVDVMGRLLAQKLSESFGEQFYIENHGGAGGNSGTALAATAPPDGYTLLITSSSFVVNPSLHVTMPYDPIKDFAPVAIAAASPNVLVVNPGVPVETVAELIEWIRKTPGGQTFATAGVGTTPHLSGELFRLSLGLDLVHVPFTGAGPALQSAVAGHTPIAFSALPSAVPLVTAGSLRALAITSAKRVAALPDVPTMAEAGLAGQEAETFIFVLAPAGTPPEIVDRLYREVARIVALPDVEQRLATLGFRPVASSPQDSAARIKDEIAKWARVISGANIERQ